jgi:hypothetical protein
MSSPSAAVDRKGAADTPLKGCSISSKAKSGRWEESFTFARTRCWRCATQIVPQCSITCRLVTMNPGATMNPEPVYVRD